MNKLIEIQAQIEALKKQAQVVRDKEFDGTVADIRAKMTAFGITVKDLQAVEKKGKRKIKDPVTTKPKPAKGTKSRTKVAAKYKGPNGEAWSGRGLTPKWLASLISQGRNKDEFAVQ